MREILLVYFDLIRYLLVYLICYGNKTNNWVYKLLHRE